jgi:glycosyltransferase involved in cell wall biosynthesis
LTEQPIPPSPRISILVNLYNGADYLREALDSVLAQTFEDWELILWDDQSTDGTASIAAGYVCERVRYYLAPQRTSLGEARKAVMRQARGEWLAFLDQDDVWLPHKLERQVELADRHPDAGLIYGRTLLFTPSGSERDFDHRHEYTPLPEEDIFLRLFIDSCFVAISSAMFRRAAILELGEIPARIEMTTDYYLFLSVARRHTAHAVQDVVCRYRWHGGNMTLRYGQRVHDEALWMIAQWEDAIGPELAAHRRRIHHSVAALYEMRGGQFMAGLSRLLRHGSLPFLLSRPFAILARGVRRQLATPYWKRSGKNRALFSEAD